MTLAPAVRANCKRKERNAARALHQDRVGGCQTYLPTIRACQAVTAAQGEGGRLLA